MNCRDLYRFPRVTATALSPRGDMLAYTVRSADAVNDRYRNELRVTQRVAAGHRPAATRCLGGDLRGPAWSPTGEILAAIAPGDAAAGDRVVLFSPDGTVRRSLGVGITRIAELSWSADGMQMAFVAPVPSCDDGSERASARLLQQSGLQGHVDGLPSTSTWQQHLLVLEVATGAVRRVTQGTIWLNGYALSPDGALVAYCARVPGAGIPSQPGTIQPSALWVTDLRSGEQTRELVPVERSARSPVFTRDGRRVVFAGLTALTVEPLGLFSIPVGGGSVQAVAQRLDRSVILGGSGPQGGTPFTTSDTVVFCARDGGSVQLYEASVANGDECRLLDGSATESISAISGDRDGAARAYVVTALDGSQQVRVVDRHGDVTVEAELETPAPVAVARPWTVITDDVGAVHGWLIRREGASAGPLLVDVHGGSFSGAWAPQVDPSRLYQQELAGAGWTVLLLNCRGSDGYGEAFARMAVGRWGEADAGDLLAAIDQLASEGLTDPGRVAVTGYSYGGFMTHWLTSTSDRFRAAVAGGSICDFVTLFGSSDMGWAMCAYDIGVHPADDPVDAFARSPLARVGRVRTPTLLLHGERDQRCPISQAEAWFAALHVRGVPAELVRYPDAGHGFLIDGPPSYAVDYGERLVAWVRQHTRGQDVRLGSPPDREG